MPFEFKRLEIPNVILIKPRVFEDERGFFMETYKKSDFEKTGIKGEFVQDNHSRSRYGVLRGLHFQREPYAQAKIVRAIRGVIYDVAVDLRRDSPTFGKWVSVILSEHNKYQLYIPRGFAHGFLVLSDVAEVVYKADNVYAPSYEGGILWNDPEIGIDWPIDDPIVSEKDRKWPTLREAIEKGWTF
ncbi:dTDP-4-dehydrorhamnose 3,5-epimerase [Thermococcus barossii]|uniref:dTDP-4-dehydrorhamnose 3,5-epimerase n=1 Tax=Thermococcus barossii TaxID=54077 RepID=A0A2Z2MGP7_9EURY|nr:dTDP-4-dehydrorhamnose 3,5-epimerase [Thermococcus barossii]ASJ05730.1 dTDP-4-dehydrorhamnose 3,5-epimerase [Thermococcus barossii]